MAGSRHWVSMDDIAAGDYPGGDNHREQRALTFDEVVELLAVAETEAEVHTVLGHLQGEDRSKAIRHAELRRARRADAKARAVWSDQRLPFGGDAA